MRMSTDIRVKTAKVYKDLYDDLRQVFSAEAHAFFVLCACIGFRSKTSKPLEQGRQDLLWSGTITPDEWCALYSMVLDDESMDFTKVQDDAEMMCKMEAYANGGMEILIKDLLDDYIEYRQGIPRLDISRCGELPKVLLGWVEQEIRSEQVEHGENSSC